METITNTDILTGERERERETGVAREQARSPGKGGSFYEHNEKQIKNFGRGRPRTTRDHRG